MAPKTIRMALAEMLQDLGKEDFLKFRHCLLDRREEPRIRRNKVEDKNYLEIADVMVSTFTEPVALEVAEKILRQIGCNNAAAELAEETRGQSSGPDSSGTASPSAGATGGNTMAGDKHFVDKYKTQLIQRVSNIAPILDELFEHDVIQQEAYDKIRALPTSQEKMRELYCGPLKAGGGSKDIFYQLLEKNEPYLISDLKKNK